MLERSHHKTYGFVCCAAAPSGCVSLLSWTPLLQASADYLCTYCEWGHVGCYQASRNQRFGESAPEEVPLFPRPVRSLSSLSLWLPRHSPEGSQSLQFFPILHSVSFSFALIGLPFSCLGPLLDARVFPFSVFLRTHLIFPTSFGTAHVCAGCV